LYIPLYIQEDYYPRYFLIGISMIQRMLETLYLDVSQKKRLVNSTTLQFPGEYRQANGIYNRDMIP
jgi:hypothetical protein